MLNVGDKAPEFTLPNQEGESVSLSDFERKQVVVWFFPKASTPGWTNEGIGFRDELKQYNKLNTTIIGVSADPPSKKKKFVDKYSFNYLMICDESHKMLKAYKAWGLKKFMGREYEGIYRISYLVNNEGFIKKVYDDVKTKSHACDILDTL